MLNLVRWSRYPSSVNKYSLLRLTELTIDLWFTLHKFTLRRMTTVPITKIYPHILKLFSQWICVNLSINPKDRHKTEIRLKGGKSIILHKGYLTLSDFRTFLYVRNPKTVATPVRIYTYTDFAIEIWGFYRRLTDTLRYHHTYVSIRTCFRSAAGSHFKHVYQPKKSGVYSELSAVFGEFWKITIVGPSSVHRLA